MRSCYKAVLILLIGLSASLHGENPDERTQGNIPLFQSNEVIKMTIQGAFPEINMSNAKQNAPQPGKLSYEENGQTVSLDMQLEARGGGRSWWCTFAPMKLVMGPKEMDKEAKKAWNKKMKKTIFANAHRDFRLITHCKSEALKTDSAWDDVVLTEHASYQILLASGLPAVNTRLVYAHYLTNAGADFDSGYLMILENDADLAQRYGVEAVDRKKGAPILNPAARVPFELGLRLIASEQDHIFDSTQNSFFIGPKLPDQSFDPNHTMQIPYDFVLSPDNFPYSKSERDYEKDWVRKYAQQNPELKSEIVRWLKVILAHRADVQLAIEQVPYQAGAFQKRNLTNWTAKFFVDAESYLANP